MFKKVQKAIPKTAAIAAIATGKSAAGAPACNCSAKAPAARAPAAKVPEKKKKTPWYEVLNENFLEFGESGYGKRLKMTKTAIAARRAYRLKKSPRRSRRSSPKRRKISQKTAHSRAKRAMKLHHTKGISLKQAWRIVLKKNKFGDSVCGQGYEVNRNWSRGKGQKQCLKECDFYEMRDHSTNRCKKMSMVKRSYGNVPLSKQAKLPRGYEINPETGRQRKICPRGYYRNPDTGRCKKIQTSLRPVKYSKQYEDLDELDSVNFRWKKGKNIPLSMQYGHSCFGSVPCDCGI